MIVAMKNLFLLYGNEKLLVKEEVEKIKSKIVRQHETLNFIPLDGRFISEEGIINACSTMPLMASKKMVLVTDANFFSGEKNSQVNVSSKGSRLIGYLEDLPQHVCLVFTCNAVDRRKKIFKIIQKNGVVCNYSRLKPKHKTDWIRDRIQKLGKNIDYSAAVFLAQFTDNLSDAEMEIKKLVSFIGHRECIKMDDIYKVFSSSTEHNIFEMIDHIGSKKCDKAIEVLNELTSRGESCTKILFMIAKHISEILAVKNRENLSFQEIREQLALHPFVLKKTIEKSRNFNIAELISALKLCQKLDLDIKKGRVDDKMGLEILLTEISKSIPL